MRGYHNHHLLQDCAFIGVARTVEKFALFTQSFPFVVSTIHEEQIYGELYDVPDAESLKSLDELEGHPDYYTRTEVDVVHVEGKQERIRAQLYFDDRTSTDTAERVLSGSFHDSLSSNRHKQVQNS